MREVPRRLRLFLVLAVVTALLFGVGWKWWEHRSERRSLVEIEEDIANARFAIAARKLGAFLSWRRGSDQALFLLGLCEKERGRPEAAARAWDAIPPNSTFAPQAIAAQMELLIDRGRVADAEQLINRMRAYPQIEGIVLGPTYCQQGRVDEAERLVEARWHRLDESGEGASEAAVNLVRLHIELRRTISSIQETRAILDHANALAPQDDRTWLGRANLAIRSGSYDEAAQLLDACLQARPEDAAVWRARLRWAMATARVEEARAALAHLSAAESSAAEIQRLVAWFAHESSDIESERRALERLIEADPADFQAIDRLIELAAKYGQEDRAALLRSQKAAIERVQARYEKLNKRNQPSRDAAEMARLAEQLGRWFEAEVFLTIAAKAEPNRDDIRSDLARIKLHAKTSDRFKGNLGAVIAPELRFEKSTRR